MSDRLKDKDTLISEISSNDWKEIQISLMEQMAAAIERPSDVNEDAAYYEKLALKIHWISSHMYRKENGLDPLPTE